MHTLNIDSLFQELLYLRDRAPDLSNIGPWLTRQVTTSSFPDLSHIPFKSAAYTRNCIAKETNTLNQGFEVLIMQWDQQVKTPIHGHPSFSFYYVIKGSFEMELFTYSSMGVLQLKEKKCFGVADTTWFLGRTGQYDNFIHRITCLEPGYTFHIYSEDAQKGLLYDERNIKIQVGIGA